MSLGTLTAPHVRTGGRQCGMCWGDGAGTAPLQSLCGAGAEFTAAVPGARTHMPEHHALAQNPPPRTWSSEPGPRPCSTGRARLFSEQGLCAGHSGPHTWPLAATRGPEAQDTVLGSRLELAGPWTLYLTPECPCGGRSHHCPEQKAGLGEGSPSTQWRQSPSALGLASGSISWVPGKGQLRWHLQQGWGLVGK